MSADTQGQVQYITADGQIWTYLSNERSLTRGPEGRGGRYAMFWVIDRFGPLTPLTVYAEVVRLKQELVEARMRVGAECTEHMKTMAERDSLAARLAEATGATAIGLATEPRPPVA